MNIFQFEKMLETSCDNQSISRSGIYEGERARIENNRKFGEILLQLQNKNRRKGYKLKVGTLIYLSI